MRLFVTATGTDIGKTFITTLLVRQAVKHGHVPTVLKPVLSGYNPDEADKSDTVKLIKAAGRPVTRDEIEAVSPYRFRAPLSPDMAAAREGRAIPFDDLVDYCQTQEQKAAGPVFVEGVGGAMVPLDDSHTVLDWMCALDYPVLLISGTYLGAISHCLTTLAVLENAGLSVAAILLNETPDSSVSLIEAASTLQRFTKRQVWQFPYLANSDQNSQENIDKNDLYLKLSALI